METFLKIFKSTWELDVKHRFEKGFLTYERQLQAFLYKNLKTRLSCDYEMWIEPVIYLKDYMLDKVKPDIIVTKNANIIAIIELKLGTWSYPSFKDDLDKLFRFKNAAEKTETIILGWIPKSEIWQKQQEIKGCELKYSLDKNVLLILAVIARPDSEAITKEYENITRFVGYLKPNEESEFKMK